MCGQICPKHEEHFNLLQNGEQSISVKLRYLHIIYFNSADMDLQLDIVTNNEQEKGTDKKMHSLLSFEYIQ